LLITPYTQKGILIRWQLVTLSWAPVNHAVVGNTENMVTDQSGIRTSNLSVTNSMLILKLSAPAPIVRLDRRNVVLLNLNFLFKVQ
jgi:hypothetical protein